MNASPGFDEAVSAHRPYLLRFARQRLRDTALVEDLVQDTLLAALLGVERFAAKATLRTWLTGILLNKIADSARREQRAPLVATTDADDSDDDAGDDPRAEPIEWRDPARMLENRQFIDVLRNSLDTLPPLAARAFALREIEGLSGEAVARELGVSAGQIAVLLHRARARLRERLHQHGFARTGSDAADFNYTRSARIATGAQRPADTLSYSIHRRIDTMAPFIPTRSSLITAGRLALATALTALIGGAYLVAYHAPVEAAAQAAPPPAMPVSVAQVIERQVVQWDEFSGRLEAVGGVDVRSRVAGTIESIHFSPGALVSKGETLIVIDPKPFAAELARAEAAVASTQARSALTASELTRAQRLLEDRAIAQREFDERRNAQLEAQAALQGAQASLQTARLNLGYTRITAPIHGRVGRAEVTAGNLVAGGASGPILTSIVSVSPIYASFEADERTYLKYASGPALRGAQGKLPIHMGLAHEDGHPRKGSIEFIDNKLDPQSGTIRVRAVFDNRDGVLAPGLYARLKMSGAGDTRAVLVTERAIGTDQHKKFVYVVEADDKVAYREVKLGPVIDRMRVVESGLAAGERIVVNGLQRIRPGAAVAPTTVAMDSAA